MHHPSSFSDLQFSISSLQAGEEKNEGKAECPEEVLRLKATCYPNSWLAGSYDR